MTVEETLPPTSPWEYGWEWEDHPEYSKDEFPLNHLISKNETTPLYYIINRIYLISNNNGIRSEDGERREGEPISFNEIREFHRINTLIRTIFKLKHYTVWCRLFELKASTIAELVEESGEDKTTCWRVVFDLKKAGVIKVTNTIKHPRRGSDTDIYALTDAPPSSSADASLRAMKLLGLKTRETIAEAKEEKRTQEIEKQDQAIKFLIEYAEDQSTPPPYPFKDFRDFVKKQVGDFETAKDYATRMRFYGAGSLLP